MSVSRSSLRRLSAALIMSSAVPAVLCSAPAYAQDNASSNGKSGSQPSGIEEIVVTAERREERLQNVPASVSAFSTDDLKDMQAQTVGDLQGSVPNLSIHEGDADNAVVYIRGIGQVDSLAFADPGVGIYLDDVYLGRAQGAFLNVYDVSRIEVLRGPQGTLYGRNTIGGAVKYVTTGFDDTFGGHAEASVGNYGYYALNAHVNVPLSDDLIAKASFARISRDGYSDNAFTGKDDGDKNLLAGRFALQYTPTSTLTLRLNFDISNDDPNTSRTPARATPVFGYPATKHDPFKVDANFDTLNLLKTLGVSFVADWQAAPSLDVKSITAYRKMTYDANLDLDATPLSVFGVFDREHQHQFSQEFQANYTGDRLKLVGGLFYFRENDMTYSGLLGPDIALVTGSKNTQLNQSAAVYGQGTYNITGKLSAVAGLRYTYETKNFIRTQKAFAASTPFPIDYGTGGVLITDIDTTANWSSLTPKFGLNYQIADDVLTYASVSKGFKSGGFDGRANDAFGATPYKPETLWAYEVGMKSTWWDRRLVANVSAFYNDYTNLQLSSFVADSHGGFAALFTNAGAATMKGVELQLTAQPLPGLTVGGVVGYLESRYDKYIGPGGTDISNQRKLVNAPRWDTQLSANYVVPLGDLGSLTLGGDVSYRSKTYPVVSSSEILAQHGYTLFNAFARYDSLDGVWYVQVGGKNLSDKHYIEQGFDLSDSLGYQLAYYGAPRTVSATVGVRF